MPISVWITFTVIVLALLAVDLGLFHRKSHTVGFKEALTWTLVWVTLSCLFGAWIWSGDGVGHGSEFGKAFFTGYLIELSLSADNVFVFALLFNYFAVPLTYQHKVLFWGIISAIVLRFIMIVTGAALIEKFNWIIYLFAAFLIFTGIKMFFSSETQVDPEKNPVVRWFRKIVPGTDDYRDDKFFVIENGKRLATPLLTVLFCVEITDVIFAVDSIPAIFAVTRDPFIVFTSNICAILGLRSLYFLLAGVMDRFIYLKPGLAIILTYVGVKMSLSHSKYKIDSTISLLVVASILLIAILASLWKTRGQTPANGT